MPNLITLTGISGKVVAVTEASSGIGDVNGIGYNVSQEAPPGFAKAVVDVDGY